MARRRTSASQLIDYDGYMRLLAESRRRSVAIHPERDELSSQASWLLIRASSLLQKDLELQVHTPAGLSWSAFRVLHNVSLLDVAEPTQLARLLGIAPASISSLLATLTKAGLVTRSRSEGNQTRVKVKLTPEGRARLDAVVAPHGEVERDFLAALTTDEKQQLASILDKLLRAHWPASEAREEEGEDE